jgi:hypothetical protein
MRQTSYKVNREKKENRSTTDNSFGWDAMIHDAQKRIEDLKFSITVFERRKIAGEPLPESQVNQQ